MDALSEALRIIRLSGALLVEAQLPDHWCYSSPRPELLREPQVPYKRVMAFHLVLEGTCVACLPGQAPVQVQEGELLLFPHGDQHILASSLTALGTLRPRQALCDAMRSTEEVLERSASPATRLICGYFSCGGCDGNAAFTRLPSLIHVKGDGPFSAWMRASLEYCTVEPGTQKAPATPIADRILELVLVQALQARLEVGDRPRSQLSPLTIEDRFLQKALALVYENPSRPWTVDELSARVGLSRSALAARFARHLGEPPKQYLARWRMALSADALLSTTDSVARIATNVGFESEAAFNRAFKRVYGLPPSRWRKDSRGANGTASSKD